MNQMLFRSRVARWLTQGLWFALLIVSTTASALAQTFERNTHGLKISYPSGDILYLGNSGDSRLEKSGGRSEYGYWQVSGGEALARFPSGTIRISAPGERVSGYCILRGQAVPDKLCW